MKSHHAAVFMLACIMLSCSEKKKTELVVTNPSAIKLNDKAVHVNRGEIIPAPENNKYPLLINEIGDTIPSQLLYNNSGSWSELFFVLNLEPNSSSTLSLSWIDTQPSYTKKTNIRFGKRDNEDTPVHAKMSDTLYANQIHGKLGYQPYQTDGPSWENDKAGFRHYFDGRNSKDYFGKKASYMSPETVGLNEKGEVEDNYHVMADWGRDVLSVNNSVGLGGINVMMGDSISRIGCVVGDTITNVERSIFQIVERGPVFSQFTLDHTWKPFDRTYQVHEQTSIWPGMYAYQNSVSVEGIKGDETFLVGLVNSNTPNPLKEISIGDDFVILMTHDQQSYNREWWLGLALILPKDSYLGYGDAPKTGTFSTSFYGKMKVEYNKPVTYYAVGTWDLSDSGFKDVAYFEAYVTDLAKQLAVKVDVDIR